jgi:hypothetical protein
MCKSASGATPAHAVVGASNHAGDKRAVAERVVERSLVGPIGDLTHTLEMRMTGTQTSVKHSDAHTATTHATLPQRARTQSIDNLRTVWFLTTMRFLIFIIIMSSLLLLRLQLHTRIAKHTPRATRDDEIKSRVALIV